MGLEIEFIETAFRHGYEPEDFFEVLEDRVLKLKSQRGLHEVYEIYGRNSAGDYLHIAYRRILNKTVVFHIRRMTRREKEMFRKLK